MLSEAGHWMCLFWATWEGLWFRPMSDAACDWPWATCLELQVVQVCGCLCWAWVYTRKPQLCTKASFYQYQAQAQVSKGPKAP